MNKELWWLVFFIVPHLFIQVTFGKFIWLQSRKDLYLPTASAVFPKIWSDIISFILQTLRFVCIVLMIIGMRALVSSWLISLLIVMPYYIAVTIVSVLIYTQMEQRLRERLQKPKK